MGEHVIMKSLKPDQEEITSKQDTIPDDVISFSETYKSYCVGVVDIVESTKITALLRESKMCRYYSVFLNTMSAIVKKHRGTVIKNIGDSLLYYFPETSDTSNSSALLDSLECGMDMIDAHNIINSRMYEKGLPKVNYRISSDHGMIMTAKSVNSFNEDIFGPTVNVCAKINSFAMPNTMVIGGDLYQIVKLFEEYQFEHISEYHNGLKFHYPVYSIKRNIV